MISIAYVNGTHEKLILSDPVLKLENAVEELMKESDNVYSNYMNKYNRYMTESAILGDEVSFNKDELITESANVFEKIGQTLINIAKRIKDVISNMLDRIRGFYKKTDLEKISEVAKKNPAIADDIVKAYNDGNLTVYDAKSIKEIEAAYMELVKHAKDKNVSPDSLSGKIKIFKNKCKEADKSGLVTVAKAAGGIATATGAILGLRKIFTDTTKSIADSNTSQGRVFDQACDAIHMLSASGDPDLEKVATGELGKAKLLQEVSTFTGMKLQGMASHNSDVLDKLGGLVKSVLTKIDKNGKFTGKAVSAIDKAADKKKQADIEAGKKLAKTANDRWNAKNPPVDRAAERAKNKEDAYDRSLSQKEADLKFRQDHEKELADLDKKQAKRNAKAQKKGQLSGEAKYFDKHENDVLDREQKKAASQSEGRLKGEDDYYVNNPKAADARKKRENKRAYDNAANQAQAKINVEGDNNNAAAIKRAEKTKAQGREEGTKKRNIKDEAKQTALGRLEANEEWRKNHPNPKNNPKP